MTFFLGFSLFAILRILRVPVLRGLTHTFYFNYTLLITACQIIFFAVWFVYGNPVLISSMRQSEEACVAAYSDPAVKEQLKFNPSIMLSIMGLVMLVHWFVFIAVV